MGAHTLLLVNTLIMLIGLCSPLAMTKKPVQPQEHASILFTQHAHTPSDAW